MQGGKPANFGREAPASWDFFWSCSVFFSFFLLLFFRVVFLFVFGSFWGAMLEPFWSPNRVNMQLMLEQRVCAFACVLVLFWRVDSLRFLHQFLLVFLIDFGIVWGGFGGAFGRPNRSFFASIF